MPSLHQALESLVMDDVEQTLALCNPADDLCACFGMSVGVVTICDLSIPLLPLKHHSDGAISHQDTNDLLSCLCNTNSLAHHVNSLLTSASSRVATKITGGQMILAVEEVADASVTLVCGTFEDMQATTPNILYLWHGLKEGVNW